MSDGRATRGDREAIVDFLVTRPLRQSLRWALEPDCSDEEVRRFHEWNVDALLTSGRVLIDGARTSVVGGRYDPIGISGRLRYAVLSPSRKGRRYGRFRLPDIPPAACERLVIVTKKAMEMRPRGRVLLLQLWGTRVDNQALASVSRPFFEDAKSKAHLFAVTAENDHVANSQLEALGLQVFRSIESDLEGLGRLVGWTSDGAEDP